ncbi:ABC transporter permease [bacterium]|nr:ABC transporter permease [bacterium]
MLKNYFKTTFKYLLNQRVFSGINLIGLASGLCVCFFALLYADFELSYDTHHKKAGRVYRLVTDIKTSTGVSHASTSGPMAPAIQAALPEVEAATRVLLDYLMVQKNVSTFGEENIAYADPSLLSVFTLPLIRGNPATVLNEPFNIMLSETAAHKYFGSTDCLDETLLLDGKYPGQVTGIMADMPYNSHFRVDILVSMSTLLEEWNPSLQRSWKRFIFYTYLLLPEKHNSAPLAAKIQSLVNERIGPNDAEYAVSLEPLNSVYLHGLPRGSRTGSAITGNINNIYIFSVIASLVLVIACFNFINLTTALSLRRAKEVGVRKVLGASRQQLVLQSLMDALILAVIAFGVAVIMSIWLLPLFNQLSGKIVSTNIFEHFQQLGVSFLIAISVGLLSGIYPAFFLCGFQAMAGLTGRNTSGPKGLVLRKVLLISQFAISIALIVATAVVYRQLNFMQNQQLGFKKDHSLVIDFYFRLDGRHEFIKQQLTTIPGVTLASISSAIPGRVNRKFRTKIENVDGELQDFLSDVYFIDYDFLGQYGIEILVGRNLSRDFASDFKEGMLVNEAAVKALGYSKPESAIGKSFVQKSSVGRIVGVVEDFHYHSLREDIRPLTMRVAPGWYTFMTLNISSQNIPATISALQQKWNELISDLPFNYFFVDDAYNAQYAEEERFGKLSLCFAALAIVISSLGILGLSALGITQRTKEIGIRKVLGASVTGIVHLLAKDFIKLTAIAFVVGVPIAWLSMNKWLQVFAYRIDLTWWVFVFAGLVVMLVTLITISFQTIKAAIANPVTSLRTE